MILKVCFLPEIFGAKSDKLKWVFSVLTGSICLCFLFTHLFFYCNSVIMVLQNKMFFYVELFLNWFIAMVKVVWQKG